MNRKILIIDDDHEDIVLLTRALARKGFTKLEHCYSAEEGLLYLKQRRKGLPDLILTDLKMPVISGLDLIWEIKAQGSLKHIPIIAFSSASELISKERALRAGAINFVPKPDSLKGYESFVQKIYNTIFTPAPIIASSGITPLAGG